ncbi:MAG: phosphatase PAP2 family protein [Acidimicrobiales bacterium]
MDRVRPPLATPDASLHDRPPLTPAGVLLRFRCTVPILAALFGLLAAAATIDRGSLLLAWDEPVTEALQGLHTPWLDQVVRTVSNLGGLSVVLVVLVLLVLVVWHECRSLALVLLAASAARPLVEWTLKTAIDRPRPDLAQLVPGNGPSFPTGHVMAAVAIWGLVPPVMALVSRRRSVWWWSVGISATVIALVGFSRVYLGVHWLSDVVGALVLGALYLLGVEWLFNWHHRHTACRGSEPERAPPKDRGQPVSTGP